MKRYAKANWKGNGKEGKGLLSTQSAVLNNNPYNFSGRFADGKGTNPEELIAAAHAGCFTMKLSFLLGDAGFVPENLDTRCDIHFDVTKGRIAGSHLKLEASVPGIDPAKFEALVKEAKDTCPISLLLNTDITYEAKLV